MALAVDATSHSIEFITSPVTWTHTCTGSDLALFVGVGVRDSASDAVTGVTYNGTALSFLRADDIFRARTEIWYWDVGLRGAIPTGAHTVSAATTTTPGAAVGGSISFTGANQTTPNDVSGGAGATGTDASPTQNITTITDNAWVIAFLTVNENVTLSIGGGQTQDYDVAIAVTNGEMSGSHQTAATTPAGSVTMNWGIGLSKNWAISLAAVRPVSGGGGGPAIIVTRSQIPVPGPRRTQIIQM